MTRSALAELVVISPTSELVVMEDFEQATHSGWSLPVTTVPPSLGRRFLGEFGRESVTLTLTNLPAHDALEVSLNVIVRGYWQGNSRPDTWRLAVDGRTLLNTSFSTYTSQSFPETYPAGNNVRGSGAVATNTLGYELSLVDSIMLEDATYRISARGAHSNNVAVLAFSSTLGNVPEAAWSLDNVAVVALSQTPRLRVTLDAPNSSIILNIAAQPLSTSRIEHSLDLLTWTFFQTVTNTATLSFPADGDQRYFRAISQ